jgi:hypothetical protein
MRDEILQDRKGFGTEWDGLARTGEQMAVGIEYARPKGIDHLALLGMFLRRGPHWRGSGGPAGEDKRALATPRETAAHASAGITRKLHESYAIITRKCQVSVHWDL